MAAGSLRQEPSAGEEAFEVFLNNSPPGTEDEMIALNRNLIAGFFDN